MRHEDLLRIAEHVACGVPKAADNSSPSDRFVLTSLQDLADATMEERLALYDLAASGCLSPASCRRAEEWLEEAGARAYGDVMTAVRASQRLRYAAASFCGVKTPR